MDKIALIPARSGSKRLPKKNYLSFNGRSIVELAIEKCIKANCFTKIVVSSDDEYFKNFTNHKNTEFLLREEALASDDATTDQVVDFVFERYATCESVMWVNSVSPLQKVKDIVRCSDQLDNVNIDCVMAVNTLYQHCTINGQPINFDPTVAFEKTQDLTPVRRYVYSCMGWKRKTYVNSRVDGFRGLFPGQMALVDVSVEAGILIKNKDDFTLAAKLEKLSQLKLS